MLLPVWHYFNPSDQVHITIGKVMLTMFEVIGLKAPTFVVMLENTINDNVPDKTIIFFFVCLIQNIIWRFKFSQLKGSSDDGKTRVKLLFHNSDTKQIEMKVSNLVRK